jgi:hypothetical protein
LVQDCASEVSGYQSKHHNMEFAVFVGVLRQCTLFDYRAPKLPKGHTLTAQPEQHLKNSFKPRRTHLSGIAVCSHSEASAGGVAAVLSAHFCLRVPPVVLALVSSFGGAMYFRRVPVLGRCFQDIQQETSNSADIQRVRVNITGFT